MAKWSPKDPQDVRDYWIDFSSLLADDETLTFAVVEVDPDQHPVTSPYVDLTVDTIGVEIVNDVLVRARYAGGTPAAYSTQYHVTTSSGQEFDLTKTLEVKERIAA